MPWFERMRVHFHDHGVLAAEARWAGIELLTLILLRILLILVFVTPGAALILLIGRLLLFRVASTARRSAQCAAASR